MSMLAALLLVAAFLGQCTTMRSSQDGKGSKSQLQQQPPFFFFKKILSLQRRLLACSHVLYSKERIRISIFFVCVGRSTAAAPLDNHHQQDGAADLIQISLFMHRDHAEGINFYPLDWNPRWAEGIRRALIWSNCAEDTCNGLHPTRNSVQV